MIDASRGRLTVKILRSVHDPVPSRYSNITGSYHMNDVIAEVDPNLECRNLDPFLPKYVFRVFFGLFDGSRPTPINLADASATILN